MSVFNKELLAYLSRRSEDVMRCAVCVNGRLDVNVALNRPAYQVSTQGHQTVSFVASNANDGSHKTIYTNGKCAHTKLEMHPWWAVDLGVPLHVTAVKFTNRYFSGSFVIFSLTILTA